MKIHNIRFGLAANSSSSHSLIFIRGGADDHAVGTREFGWDFFTAGSKQTKKDYLAVTLLSNLRKTLSQIGKEAAEKVLNEFIPGHTIELEEKSHEFNGEKETTIEIPGYIDHQSAYVLPRNRINSDEIDKEFFDDMVKYFDCDDLVILGGNDNTEDSHPLSNGDNFNLPLPLDASRENWIARKDKKYDYWTLFNPQTGTKIRFSFRDDLAAPAKAFAPELVDMKITNYCPLVNSPCYKWCYQNSTTKGVPATLDYIKSIVDSLKELGVLEIALGGGETTMHPNFVEILKYIRESGIVPNFTTRSIAWLKDADRVKEIMKYAGSFAYSVMTADDIKNLMDAIEPLEVFKSEYDDRHNISVQHVLGTHNLYELEELLNAAHEARIRVTLLGYKSTGRGDKAQDYSDWCKVVYNLNETYDCPDLAIDTVLAAEFEQELLSMGISDHLFHTLEGKFSMYVDAVDKKIGASSYCEKEQMVNISLDKPLTQYIIDEFEKF